MTEKDFKRFIKYKIKLCTKYKSCADCQYKNINICTMITNSFSAEQFIEECDKWCKTNPRKVKVRKKNG